mmetsp:Transcript_34525/g.52822  ORF Transcript_34525/g.52822 Transcript_34525/m.52822 type:complete len:116 (+) Transcript_34525:216-563(+)
MDYDTVTFSKFIQIASKLLKKHCPAKKNLHAAFILLSRGKLTVKQLSNKLLLRKRLDGFDPAHFSSSLGLDSDYSDINEDSIEDTSVKDHSISDGSFKEESIDDDGSFVEEAIED